MDYREILDNILKGKTVYVDGIQLEYTISSKFFADLEFCTGYYGVAKDGHNIYYIRLNKLS